MNIQKLKIMKTLLATTAITTQTTTPTATVTTTTTYDNHIHNHNKCRKPQPHPLCKKQQPQLNHNCRKLNYNCINPTTTTTV